ncbi:hypothetical protein [Paenibacillus sp. FSL M7-0656]|uniref:hypothetical protein n=1 Tax=unclassified Paenibacillus TaxID=185978 RepID=UPI0030F74508
MEDNCLASLPKEYVHKIAEEVAFYRRKIEETAGYIRQNIYIEFFITTPSGVYSYSEENDKYNRHYTEKYLEGMAPFHLADIIEEVWIELKSYINFYLKSPGRRRFFWVSENQFQL